MFKEKTTLTEENGIISNDDDTAQVLNTLFSKIVGSLNIPGYVTNVPINDSDKKCVLLLN